MQIEFYSIAARLKVCNYKISALILTPALCLALCLLCTPSGQYFNNNWRTQPLEQGVQNTAIFLVTCTRLPAILCAINSMTFRLIISANMKIFHSLAIAIILENNGS